MRTVFYTLVDDGTPVPCPDLLTWGQWMATSPRVVVAHDRDGAAGLPAGVRVSTRFFGFDLGLPFRDTAAAPLLWESMMFAPAYPFDLTRRRYASEAEAIAGHAALCAIARAVPDVPDRGTP